MLVQNILVSEQVVLEKKSLKEKVDVW